MTDTTEYEAIGKLDVHSARTAGMDIINKSKSTNMKKARLCRDIQKAYSAQEVVRILWMCALASEGLSSMDSSWNKV